ncbi:MAG: biopolymer transporter ExbD [Spongiibacter sp.]|nr:biopolymer transporter ExbD [Spongiibacter sp.]
MTSRRRERRAEQSAKRAEQSGEMNIVSLIDIFAILVFYLLVNALVVEVIPAYENLTPPLSSARETPIETVNLAVSRQDILVNDRVVMTLDEALAAGGPLAALTRTLLPLAGKAPRSSGTESTATSAAVPLNEINIVADESIPYHLLKRILASCTEARFERISLAVEQAPGASEV